MKNQFTKENIYELNPSQEVVLLQSKYTLFKRIINILTSITSKTPFNFTIMEKAYNLLVERNDCLRIQFIKKNKKLCQYFRKEMDYKKVPIYTFTTEKEQLAFLNKIKKKPIAYKKGVVIEPYFINTFDNKTMVFFKVCHLILDIYGINIIFKDLYEIYLALLNGDELPNAPTSFEELVQKDLEKKHDIDIKNKDREYFTSLLNNSEEPYYVGLHGDTQKIWQKQRAKNKRSMKMFFINCDTQSFSHPIDKELNAKVNTYCLENKYSPANLYFYASSLCASLMNNKINKMIPLELCNCRGTMKERKCAGTKVQSVACLTSVDYNKTFKENFDEFCNLQQQNYRHVGFEDQAFEMLLHKTYHSSLFETYYSITFSYIPFSLPSEIEFNVYSNGKCALPAYFALLTDSQSGETQLIYDVQTKIISEKDVELYHSNLMKILNQILLNQNVILKDIEL